MQRTSSRLLLSMIVLIMLVLAVPLSVQADGGEDGFVQTVNGYEVELVFAGEPAVGENQIHIQIHDAMDMPVYDANVEIILAAIEDGHAAEAPEASHADMPGMDAAVTEVPGHEGMSGMDMTAHNETQSIALEPAHESGEYAGEIHIESAGEWMISVHLDVQGEVMELDFPLTVKSNSRNGILAGFVGVNILILIVAAAFKSRSAAQ